MKIKSIELKNFKKFTDLRIENIPESAKLVLLIGPNGSGKSSVFDAFEYINTKYVKSIHDERRNQLINEEFYQKGKNSIEITFTTEKQVFNTLNQGVFQNEYLFYGRTSYRQTPKLKRYSLGNIKDGEYYNDYDRPIKSIDKDEMFENDIEKLFEEMLRAVFIHNTQASIIKENYIKPINNAFKNIFQSKIDELILDEFIPPIDGKVAQINFKKGNSIFHYDFLSAGEKEVVNILFNLLARKSRFTDTVYFLDEIDLHLNTKIQYNLLKEITENWIPDNCQLWTASHSLGFIEYAKQSDSAVILDFDDLNFDEPQVISPQSKEKLDLYEIAVPREILSNLFTGKKIVFCENKNDSYYNLLGLENTIFIGVNNSNDVFHSVKRDKKYLSIRDRDFLTDNEIDKIKLEFPNHRILKYYNFENFIYHPDNLYEAIEGFDKQEYISQITAQKNKLVEYDIIPSLDSSRQSYAEFKENNRLKDSDKKVIVDSLKSDDFETFYKFFNMRDKFNHSKYQKIILSKSELVKTKWFKEQIEKCLNENN